MSTSPPWHGILMDFPGTRPTPPNDIGLQVARPSRPGNGCLACGSSSSDREFACCFLQIPPRDGHPCSSARSSCHQGLHRDSHPTSHFLVRFRSPVTNRHSRDASRHARRTMPQVIGIPITCGTMAMDLQAGIGNASTRYLWHELV